MTTVMAPVGTRTPFDPEGRLRFLPEPHEYYLDEVAPYRRLLSVTQAIEEALAGTLGESYWNEANRTRGQHVHEAILFHAHGDLVTEPAALTPTDDPNDWRRFMPGYFQFLEEERPDIVTVDGTLCVEQKVFDENAGYAGTFDILCRLRGPQRYQYAMTGFEVLDLIDAKSGSVPWTALFQVAAYRRCILAYLKKVIIRPFALHLRGDGTYHLVPLLNFPGVQSADAERKFLSILEVAKLKRMHAC